MVAVLSKTGVRLMPTTRVRARKLIKKGRAVIEKYLPFTIRLLDREDGDVQEIEFCCDTGYIYNGISIKSEKHEYISLQADALEDEKKKHEEQAAYRRGRRNRKRYRKPRFNNRKRKEKWLPPSIEHKKDIPIYWLKVYSEVMPITSATFEMGQFDTQLLKALEEGKPIPKGTDYQHGERYGTATLREAVFTRDQYTCQCCGRSIKDGAILHVHHIVYRSQGGTDRMANLATVCEKCHTPKNHKPGGKLWQWKPKLKSFKGATYMTSVRWILYEELKEKFPDIPIHITYGAKTKCRRRELDIEKSHVNDAYVMGYFQPAHRHRLIHLKKKRRNNRRLEKFYDAKYIDSRDGKKKSGQELSSGRISRNHKKDSENLHPYRKEKVEKGRRSIRRQRYPLQPGDKVLYQGRVYTVKGCQSYGRYVALKGLKNAPSVKEVRLLRRVGGWVETT